MPVPTPQREYTSAALEALIFRVTFSRSYTGRPDFSSGYLTCKVWNIRKQRGTERMKKDKTPKHMVLGTRSGHLSEVSERCHPCPARFSLVCTGRAHSRFWNKPFALKTPDRLFLLQKKQTWKALKPTAVLQKDANTPGLRSLIFPTWAEVNKQDFFKIKTQTSAVFLPSLWYSGEGRETARKTTRAAAWDWLQKLKSHHRWRSGGPSSPHLLHTHN